MVTVTLVALDRFDGGIQRAEYRAEGPVSCPTWRASLREGRAPYCYFSIWSGPDRDGDMLSSYGGEVWPTAWPELFQALPASVAEGSGRIRLTPAGRAALGSALDRPTGKPAGCEAYDLLP